MPLCCVMRICVSLALQLDRLLVDAIVHRGVAKGSISRRGTRTTKLKVACMVGA